MAYDITALPSIMSKPARTQVKFDRGKTNIAYSEEESGVYNIWYHKVQVRNAFGSRGDFFCLKGG